MSFANREPPEPDRASGTELLDSARKLKENCAKGCGYDPLDRCPFYVVLPNGRGICRLQADRPRDYAI